ncbi:S41 family peptidase [Virgisporangium aliadipatigenens]|nr:S41 family peptidase [Virgisporangium aliadipatigenens]
MGITGAMGRAAAGSLLVLALLQAAGRTPPETVAARYLDEALRLLATNALDTHRVDWRALRHALRRQIAGARSTADTYPAIQRAIAALGNPHTSFVPPAPAAPGWAPPAPVAVAVPTGRTVGRLAYVTLPGLLGTDDDNSRYAAAGAAVVAALDAAGPCGWIVDLRADTGGNMWPMLTTVAPLLGDGTHGWFAFADGTRTPWGTRDGAPFSGDTPLFTRWRNGHTLRRPAPPVAVLTGSRTASAGEAVLIAFRGRPRTRVFGRPTAGLATANMAFTLSDGAILTLTVANDADRTGRVYGAGPIAPDEYPANLPGSDDPALDTAVAWLNGRTGC